MAVVGEAEIDGDAAQRIRRLQDALQAVTDAQLPEVLVYGKACDFAKNPAQMIGRSVHFVGDPRQVQMLVKARGQQVLHIVNQAALSDIARVVHGAANHAVKQQQHRFFDRNRIVETSGGNGLEEAALQQIGPGVAAPPMPPERCVLRLRSGRANRLQRQIAPHGKPVAAIAAIVDFAALVNL